MQNAPKKPFEKENLKEINNNNHKINIQKYIRNVNLNLGGAPAPPCRRPGVEQSLSPCLGSWTAGSSDDGLHRCPPDGAWRNAAMAGFATVGGCRRWRETSFPKAGERCHVAPEKWPHGEQPPAKPGRFMLRRRPGHF
jgi:hypothetical protein